MKLTQTAILREKQTTEQYLKREINYNRTEAFILREHAKRLIEKAHILEREAEYFEQQLQEKAA